MVDIQSMTAEIRQGIKKDRKKKKPHGKNIMSTSATYGGHNQSQQTMPNIHIFSEVLQQCMLPYWQYGKACIQQNLQQIVLQCLVVMARGISTKLLYVKHH